MSGIIRVSYWLEIRAKNTKLSFERNKYCRDNY